MIHPVDASIALTAVMRSGRFDTFAFVAMQVEFTLYVMEFFFGQIHFITEVWCLAGRKGIVWNERLVVSRYHHCDWGSILFSSADTWPSCRFFGWYGRLFEQKTIILIPLVSSLFRTIDWAFWLDHEWQWGMRCALIADPVLPLVYRLVRLTRLV